VNDGKLCAYKDRNEHGEIVCIRRAKPNQLYCSREHAPFGYFDVDPNLVDDDQELEAAA
jgi:hypothetical protein